MSASDVRAGGAYVELFTKDASLYRGLARAQARFSNFGSVITGIGTKITAATAAAFAPFAIAGKMFVEVGDNLDELADKTSISVETMSALRYVAQLTDTSLEDMAKGLEKAQKLVAGASNGNKKAVATLKELGLSAEDIIDLAPEHLFSTLAEAISKITNPTLRAAISLQVFGKGAGSLAEVVKKGGAEIDRLTKEAKDLGLIMSGEDAAAAAGFKDALYGLTQQVSFLIGVGFAPWLRETAEWMSKAAARTAAFMKQNQALVRTIVKGIAVIGSLGVGLIVVGTLFSSIAAIIGGVMVTLTAIGAAFGAVSGAITFMISPMGIATRWLGTLVYYLLRCTDVGKKMVSTLVVEWRKFASESTESFKAVGEAIRAGDIDAAWRVVTSLLSLEWTKFTSLLQTSWAQFKGTFLGVWNETMSAFSQAWNDGAMNGAIAMNQIIKGTQIAWTELLGAMQQGWVGFVKFVRTHWNTASTWIGEVLARSLEQVGALPEGTTATVTSMGKDNQKDIDSSSSQISADASVERARNRLKIEEDANAREADIRRQHKDRMLGLDKDQQKQEEEIKKSTNAVVEAQKQKVDEARRAWEGAVAAANQAGQDADKQLIPPNVSGSQVENLLPRQKSALDRLDDPNLSAGRRARIERGLGKQGIDVAAYKASQNASEGVANAMGKVESRGTFNPMALQSLMAGGGGDTASKQLDEQKKAREEAKKQTQTLKSIDQGIKKKGYLTFA